MVLTRQQAAAEPQLQLLHLPGDVLGKIAALAPPQDRASLAACCHTLTECSRHHSALWWGELQLVLAQHDPMCSEQAASLAAWLATRRPALRKLDVCRKYAFQYPSSGPSVLLPSPPLLTLADLRLLRLAVTPAQVQSIAGHTQLTELMLSQGGIDSLEPLTSLHALRVLNLDDNPLSTRAQLHPLGSLSRLESLSLRGCEIVELPPSWAALTRLTSLSILDCRLDTLPASLSMLSALRRFKCGISGQLSGSLAPLAALPHLEAAHVSGCNFTAFSPGLSTLTGLRQLDIRGNCHLADWEHLAGLTGLTKLWIGDCTPAAVPTVPASLSVLTNLRHLHISRIPFSASWQHLAPLLQLRTLWALSCGLIEVPPVVGRLTALQQLAVGGSPQLAGGWHHLAPLSQLQELATFGCSSVAGLQAVLDNLPCFRRWKTRA